MVNKMKINKIVMIIILSVFLLFFIPAFLILSNSGIWFRSDINKPILLSSSGSNYSVTIKLNQIQKNNYFGEMHFANYSDKDLNFILGHDILNSDGKNEYNIYIRNEKNSYPLYSDSIASVSLSIPKDKITTYPIVIYNIPENIDWRKSELIISDSIFK